MNTAKTGTITRTNTSMTMTAIAKTNASATTRKVVTTTAKRTRPTHCMQHAANLAYARLRSCCAHEHAGHCCLPNLCKTSALEGEVKK